MYDLIILGAGPAGYRAAERAGAAGLNTVLIEKSNLGGVCLNEGCIPSKTILNSARLYTQAKHSQAFGVNASNVVFDLATVMARKEKIVNALRKGIATTLKKNRVTVETGEGKILDRKGMAFRVKVSNRIVEGKHLLVCTGSTAVRLNVPGVDQKFVFTNKELFSIDFIPENFVVIGGGAVGLEMAVFFAEIGSKVTVIELLSSIGGQIDFEIAQILQKELEKINITFKLLAKVDAIEDHVVVFEMNENKESIKADVVLMSVGRRPMTEGIGLDNLNVQIERGAVKTDEQGRTNIPGIWAAGDVNGISMLAHTAYREAEVCINGMLNKEDRVRYSAIPAVIYTHPEVANVGLTVADAEKLGIEVVSAKLPLSYSGRYLAENERDKGVCKVVIDKKDRTLIGVHMIGGMCSEMIFGAATMIDKKMKIDEIKEIVFPHPTVSEIIKDTLWHV
jgi:dihydrolipoamide dehydrogenase